MSPVRSPSSSNYDLTDLSPLHGPISIFVGSCSVGRIPLLVKATTYLKNPKLRQEEILKSDESCTGEEIPLLAEEGWTRHEENVPLPIWRGRGGAKRKPDAKRKRDSAQPQERAQPQ